MQKYNTIAILVSKPTQFDDDTDTWLIYAAKIKSLDYFDRINSELYDLSSSLLQDQQDQQEDRRRVGHREPRKAARYLRVYTVRGAL